MKMKLLKVYYSTLDQVGANAALPILFCWKLKHSLNGTASMVPHLYLLESHVTIVALIKLYACLEKSMGVNQSKAK